MVKITLINVFNTQYISSSFLQPVLNFYSRYIVNDSFEVVDRIRNISSKNTFMSSFDVKKFFFTNVPLEEIIQISLENAKI